MLITERQEIRVKMQEMGKLAGVPIEPPEQTELLKACVSVAGVVGGGVPGGEHPLSNHTHRTITDNMTFSFSRWVRRHLGPGVRPRRLPRGRPSIEPRGGSLVRLESPRRLAAVCIRERREGGPC